MRSGPARGFWLAALFCAAAWSQQYTITTVAGNGTQGFSGDGGAPTSAQLGLPGGIAFDNSGNLYIADGANHRVRMVSNGTITTIAGTGTAGFAGDGKAATAAQLNDPLSIAVDSAGNIFIADTGNNVVRKIASGTITTVAGNNTLGYAGDGGAATSANLYAPAAIVLDSSGNLYIADAGNNVVRKVASGTISTIVGGSATILQLNHPTGLAIDAAGTLYIADTVNRRIVKFASGAATVIAGTGTPAFSGDFGPATKAALNDPTGVAVDLAGNVYIADTFNNRIRKVYASDGTIATIAGTGAANYSGDGGLATSAGLYFPHGVLVNANGQVYVADTTNNAIRLLQVATPVITDGGVGNAASFSPQISPGALATIFGSNFATARAAASLPLPTTLGGVSVQVAGRSAPMFFVSSGQINFQVPWATPPGTAPVTVSVGGVASNTVNVKVLAAGPGLFTYSPGRAVVQNSDFTLNTPGNPAKAGSTIVAYLTGSGTVTPALADGAVTPVSPLTVINGNPTATIGPSAAQVTFAGLTPNFVGLLQMNIVVPPSLASGDYPLAVAINGETSNSGTISVSQ